jgi:hypothetical protein
MGERGSYLMSFEAEIEKDNEKCRKLERWRK